MHPDALSNSGADRSNRLLSLSETAKLLGVHISTVRRWISAGKLPAYRVGDRGIRVRYQDLDGLVELVRPGAGGYSVSRLTEEQKREALAAIDEARRIQEAQADRQARSSWELINEERDLRTKQLLKESTE